MTLVSDIFKSQEQVRIVDVTPEMAQKLLEKSNYSNRKIRPAVVSKYAKIMRAGDWRFSPETICLSKTGRLLNGQHRMSAVAASGVTCRFLFASGFDDEVYEVIDRGVPRSAADALKIDKKLAECATILARSTIPYSFWGNLSDFDVKRAAALIQAAHEQVIEKCNTVRPVFSSAPFRLACAARVMEGIDPEYALETYRNLINARIEILPPMGHAAVRAVMTGKLFGGGGNTQFVNLCAAWDIYNSQSSYKSKLYVRRNQDFIEQIQKATGYVA